MFGLGGSDLSMVSSRLRVRASSCSSCLQTSFCSGPADAPSRSQRSLRAFDWNTGHIDDSFLLTREEARIKFIFVHESLWKEELQKHVLKVHSWSAHYEAHHRSRRHSFIISLYRRQVEGVQVSPAVRLEAVSETGSPLTANSWQIIRRGQTGTLIHSENN